MLRRFLILSVLSVLSVLSLFLSLPCSAEEIVEEVATVEYFPGAYASGVKIKDGKISGGTDSILRMMFYSALNRIYEGGFGEAGAELDELKRIAREGGYSNLPDYSFELLGRARQAEEEGRGSEVSFLLLHAVELSPKDPRVQFVAASFYATLGIGAALDHALSGLSCIWSYPLMLGTFGVNVLLLALTAATLAFFVVCLIQMVRNGELVFEAASSIGPRAFQGYIAASAMMMVLLLPLFGGILFALGVWALVLSRCKDSCKWLGVLAAALILAWSFSIPVVSTVGFNSELRANRVMEDIGNMSFTPKGEEFLNAELERNPTDSLLLTALAQVVHMKGQPELAEPIYRQALVQIEGDSGLRLASRINLAAIHHSRGEYEEAKQILEDVESEGSASFELYYNLALAHLGLLDTLQHKEYYLKAKGMDESRMADLQALSEEGREPLVSGVPRSFYLPLLNRPVSVSSEAEGLKVKARQGALAASLMREGSVFVLMGFGGLVLLLGFLSVSKRKGVRVRGARLGKECANADAEESSIWLFLPAGLFCAGERPLAGVFGLGLFLALLMTGMEAPMRLYAAFPVEVSFRPLFFGLAAVVFLSTALLSVAMKSHGTTLAVRSS